MSQELLRFNGVDGASGEYLMPAMVPEELTTLLSGKDVLAEVKQWLQRFATGSMKILRSGGLFSLDTGGIDQSNVAASGWGVVFADDVDPAVMEALQPLLEHRRRQTGQRFKTLWSRPGESHRDFLRRNKVGYQLEVDKVPYYLLLVGNPESITYRFQQQLDIQYAVGRLSLEGPENYANYASAVIESETNGARSVEEPLRANFFSVCHDEATEVSTRHLVAPLARGVSEHTGWRVEQVIEERATKSALADHLGGEATPDLLFSASHGIGFPKDDPRQPTHQGAVLCQDWSGPGCYPRGGIPESQYYAGQDIASDAQLKGMIHFHFGCYGAGTPRYDTFGRGKVRELAPRNFDARLPQRMLGHPRGGALAVLAHVDRSWAFSFICRGIGRQLEPFEQCLDRLMSGKPVGHAMEPFDRRYADFSADLSRELEDVIDGRRTMEDDELIDLWIATNDARSYAVLGDPAVKLQVPPADEPSPRQQASW